MNESTSKAEKQTNLSVVWVLVMEIMAEAWVEAGLVAGAWV